MREAVPDALRPGNDLFLKLRRLILDIGERATEARFQGRRKTVAAIYTGEERFTERGAYAIRLRVQVAHAADEIPHVGFSLRSVGADIDALVLRIAEAAHEAAYAGFRLRSISTDVYAVS